MRKLFILILFVGSLLQQLSAQVTQSLWVGQSYTCDATSALIGLTSDMSWSTSGGYFSLSGSGAYRTITIYQYFFGTASIKCSWKERLTSNSQWTSRSKTWYFTCRDNQVYITPSSMTLSVGESDYVGYSHQYDNNYTNAAKAYFSSSNSSIVAVNEHTGEVIAKSPGKAYINVYSKISSVSPYCEITVNEVDVQSVSIPNTISIIAGETIQLSKTVNPSNGTVNNISWHTDNESVATVNSSGTLTAVKHGTANVYCIINNTIKSNEAIVTVSKSTLKISASEESGLLNKGTAVSLSANDANAEIYYTIDGSMPTVESFRYKEPIVIDRSLTLKAIACHEDYNTSEVLVRNFNVTSLEIVEIYPNNNADMGRHIVPHVTFNKKIYKSENIEKICLKKGDEPIEGGVFLSDSTVYFVPSDYLERGMSYTFFVPQNSICTSTSETIEDVVVSFSTGKFPISVAAGYDMAAVLMSDGSLWTWGKSDLGNGSSEESLTPTKIMEDVKKVDLGFMHGVALKNDNTFWAWGRNDSGQLGDGTCETRLSPVRIMDNVRDVSTYHSHTAIIKEDNSLWMCGTNYFGQIGDGTTTTRTVPVKILDNVKSASTGESHTAAITLDGILYTWGWDAYEQLGGWQPCLGEDEKRKTPFKISEVSNVQMVSCGDYHTAAIDGDGALRTAGSNSNGQLGLGDYASKGEFSSFVRPIQNGVAFVSAGGRNTAIIKEDGDLYICGDNDYGMVEKDNYSKNFGGFRYKLSDVKSVDIGHEMIIAITNSGDVYAWGNNFYGQIGTGSKSPSKIDEPTKIMSGSSSSPLEEITLPSVKDGYIGKDLVLVPSIMPYNAEFNTIKWSSSNDDVAIVSQRGVVTGVSEGETVITVVVESHEGTVFKASCMVEIKEALKPTIINITLNKTSATLIKGESLVLTTTIFPDDAHDRSITWSSSDETIAAVDSLGNVTAILAGTATITAIANDGSGVTASCEVTVMPASYVVTYLIDGEVFATDTVICGAPVNTTIEPQKEGYTFRGWSEVPEMMPAYDIILNATFSINKYLVTFKIGDKVIAEESLEYGATIIVPDAPEMEDYAFMEWTDLLETVPSRDVEFVAVYEQVGVHLVDGVNSFVQNKAVLFNRIRYTRNFKNTNWQALYVPFEIPYENIKDDFVVAYINDVHQFDDDDDGAIDRTQVEAVKVTGGVLRANYPYMIRAKVAGEKTITVTDAILYATEENSIDCSSVFDTYTFTGTYSKIPASELPKEEGYYALSGGSWKHLSANSSLGAFRMYMKIDSRDANATVEARAIEMRVIGDDEEGATGIENPAFETQKSELIYDLQGRRVENPTKGLYIVDGRKVWVE
ncbi:MAG: Ig-like domain-containing protein [Bacteroidaceae bacterium]|nr:Ig-like domain-containing protein [Bacteroidaceae bacterium]